MGKDLLKVTESGQTHESPVFSFWGLPPRPKKGSYRLKNFFPSAALAPLPSRRAGPQQVTLFLGSPHPPSLPPLLEPQQV